MRDACIVETPYQGPCVQRGHCVSSPGYPEHSYTDNEWCVLRPVRDTPIEVEAFNTESGFDFLTVNGQGFSGSESVDGHYPLSLDGIAPEGEPRPRRRFRPLVQRGHHLVEDVHGERHWHLAREPAPSVKPPQRGHHSRALVWRDFILFARGPL